jgi:alanyl-tRNA synthetase
MWPAASQALLPGAQAFMLYDTFGFPLEITQEVAAERGVEVDQLGFEQAMEAQRAQSQAAAVSVDVTADGVFAQVPCRVHCATSPRSVPLSS